MQLTQCEGFDKFQLRERELRAQLKDGNFAKV
jgi:hypothetical protein